MPVTLSAANLCFARILSETLNTAATAALAAPAESLPSPAAPETTRLTRSLRVAGLVLLLLGGLLTVVLCFAFIPSRWQQRLKQGWSALMLRCLGIRLHVSLPHLQAGSLVVANHVSWVDILALNAAYPTGFVSKAEVRQWPLIGWLAARNDTIFLRRGSRGHARIVNAEIARHLSAGKNLTVFPEGTTTDGTHMLHFHAALLQPALEISKPLVAVALAYQNADGSRSLAPAYIGDTSLGQSLQTILGCRTLVARVVSCGCYLPEDGDRRQLAHLSREAICEANGLPPDAPKAAQPLAETKAAA